MTYAQRLIEQLQQYNERGVVKKIGLGLGLVGAGAVGHHYLSPWLHPPSFSALDPSPDTQGPIHPTPQDLHPPDIPQETHIAPHIQSSGSMAHTPQEKEYSPFPFGKVALAGAGAVTAHTLYKKWKQR